MTTKGSRGRPLSFDRDDVLDLIIPVFWRQGYDVSLDDLAEAAGLNRTNLRAAFGSKEGLFRAALRRYRDLFGAGAFAALRAPPTLAEGLHDFFEYAVTAYAGGGPGSCGCFVFSVAPAAAAGHSDIARDLADALDLVQEAFLARLAQATKSEVRDQVRAVGMADALLGLLLSLALHARSGAQPPRLRALYQSALRAILNQH